MDRTRSMFIGILVVAALIAGGVWVSNFFGGTGSGGVLTQEATEVPKGTVVVTIANSNTKKVWFDAVIAKFNQEKHQTETGNLIVVEVEHVTSGGSMDAILAGTKKPTVWSPGDSSWVASINQRWEQIQNRPIASQPCPATVYAPIGFAMWKPMAETLGWPNPVSWNTIVELAADPQGWGKYDRPEWGTFRFGHTHPAYANSGLLAMTTFVYGVAGKTSITPSELYEPNIIEAMSKLENNTSKYGTDALEMLKLMMKQGPSYLHAVAAPEADTLIYNTQYRDQLAFPLAFIFPKEGTIWAEHPYCILDNTDWVSAEQKEGAQLFLDYLLAKEQQEMAIDGFLRPIDTSIPLRSPLDLANGTDPNITPAQVPALPSPTNEIKDTVVDLFLQAKRKATTVIVLDTSGSMQEDNRIGTATNATVEFLRRLDRADKIATLTFNSDVTVLSQPALVADVGESLSGRISGLIANGNTSLYDAVCDSYELIKAEQEADRANGETRLYGIILLSDGENTSGRRSENQMFTRCLPSNAEADGIKVFPIAFGGDADATVLQRIADVTGGRMFQADPSSISKVYLSISAEQ